MSEYKNKYLKYKNKYLKLKGGEFTDAKCSSNGFKQHMGEC